MGSEAQQEVRQLEARVQRLEEQLSLARRVDGHRRAVAAGIAAGVAAVVVAYGLPWLRLDTAIEARDVFERGTLSTATGWELAWWALSGPEGARGTGITAFAMVPPLLAAVAGIVALVLQHRIAVTVAAWLGGCGTFALLMLMLGWDSTQTTTTHGVYAALLGCAAITGGAIAAVVPRR